MNLTDISVILKTQGLKLLAGLAVVGIGFSIIHWVMNIIRKHVKKLPIDPTLENFLNNIIRLILYLIVILTTANVIGIPMTSVITLLGTAGVAISLAVQGVLSNLVGGVMLLSMKPIKVGEYVKINDAESSIEGTVRSIGAI